MSGSNFAILSNGTELLNYLSFDEVDDLMVDFDFECVFGYQVVKPQWKARIDFKCITKNNAPTSSSSLPTSPHNGFSFFFLFFFYADCG
jgi:hypothetical protein